MNIAIDLGKWNSYVVMKDDSRIVKEGYVKTTREDFLDFFGNVVNPKIIVESSSTTNWIANMFEGYDITVAHPAKVRLIAEAVKKTDKIDAHTTMDLYEKDYLPESHLPSKEVRDARDLCRDRSLLVKQKVATINKIKYHAFCLGIPIKGSLRKKVVKRLSSEPQLELLIKQLENINDIISKYDQRIDNIVKGGDSRICHYARLIDTIPGFGPCSSFIVASEIDDVSRFPDEFRLFSFAGVVPKLYQSGDKEWRGHITHGNTFLKTTLLQCTNTHLICSKTSAVTYWYDNNKYRIGRKKAKIAAIKRLLRIMYWMLKRDEEYRDR